VAPTVEVRARQNRWSPNLRAPQRRARSTAARTGPGAASVRTLELALRPLPAGTHHRSLQVANGVGQVTARAAPLGAGLTVGVLHGWGRTTRLAVRRALVHARQPYRVEARQLPGHARQRILNRSRLVQRGQDHEQALVWCLERLGRVDPQSRIRRAFRVRARLQGVGQRASPSAIGWRTNLRGPIPPRAGAEPGRSARSPKRR